MAPNVVAFDANTGVYAREALKLRIKSSKSLCWESLNKEENERNAALQNLPWKFLKREAEAMATFLRLLLSITLVKIIACAHDFTKVKEKFENEEGKTEIRRVEKKDDLHITARAGNIVYHVYFHRGDNGETIIDRVTYPTEGKRDVFEKLNLHGKITPEIERTLDFIRPSSGAAENTSDSGKVVTLDEPSAAGNLSDRVSEKRDEAHRQYADGPDFPPPPGTADSPHLASRGLSMRHHNPAVAGAPPVSRNNPAKARGQRKGKRVYLDW